MSDNEDIQDASLEKNKRKRASLKSRLTIFKNYVNTIEISSGGPEFVFPLCEFKLRLSKAKLLLDNFDEIQLDIECQTGDLQCEIIQREQFENEFYSVISKAENIMLVFNVEDRESLRENSVHGSRHRSNSSSSNESQNNQTSSNIKLPTIQLPKFTGNYENWLEFHDSFHSMIIQNTSINMIQKFYYLKSSVSGIAERVINSIPVSSDNFLVAWKMLCERFANNELLVYNHTKCIFNLQKITKQSSFSIRKLTDGLQSNLRSLQSLNEPVDKWDTLLIFLLLEKLDSDTASEWESKKPPEASLNHLLSFLKNKADILEKIEANKRCSVPNKERDRYERNPVVKSLVSSRFHCQLCKSSDHKINNCNEFLNLSISDRIEQAKKLRVCHNCLHPGHQSSTCKYGKCTKCSKKHHTLIHIDNPRSEVQETTINSNSSNSNALSTQALAGSVFNKNVVLLSTVAVQVFDRYGVAHECRVLLDSGSESNFISTNLVDKLCLSKERSDISVIGITQMSSNITHKCNISIKAIQSSFSVSLTCLVADVICGKLPGCHIDLSSLPIPPNIQLSDKNFNVPSKVDLLIGASLFYELLCVGQIRLGPRMPILQKTKFGWVISGPLSNHPTHMVSCHVATSSHSDELSRFWEIEELPSSRILSKEEEECENHFKQTITRNVDGRFVVSIPLKDSVQKLGESRAIAERRFYSVERKLQRNPTMKERYISFLNEYVSMNHMSKVDDPKNTISYYLPHHGVLKEDSLTTKLRVVFDGSSPTTSGISLNDIQMVGPVVQNDLLSILLRFREHLYVISADIEKMYRQVLVSPSQRNLQQILWRSDPSEPLQTYVLNTVTYGTAAASFLATRCLVELSHENAMTHPQASKVISNDFYVDDLITGSDSIPELISLCQQVIEILSKGCFPLRKWVSNEPLVLDGIQESISFSNIAHSFGPNENNKTLGLNWYPQSDCLTYLIPSEQLPKTITKRSILSGIAKIFDPLGLLSPATIQAKIMLQQLWLERLGWDQSVPLNIHTEWLNFRHQLPQLNNLQISRKVKLCNAVCVELHGFCDASELAYGACLYVRSIDQSGKVQISLLCAKSKVAPLKKITIPRLELCAALILSRLVTKVLASTSLTFTKQFYWSDSTVVLGWLRLSPHLLKTFVANRVSEIQDSTESSCWNHIRSADNPADLISRGINPSKLKSSHLWWHGPSFLEQTFDTWPSQFPSINNGDLPDIKQVKSTTLLSRTEFKFHFENFSQFPRLKRAVAFCFRFINNSLARVKNTEKTVGPISVAELERSVLCLVKLAQAESFPSELSNLSKGQSLRSQSKLLSINPFIDQEGILRVGGRLGNSSYSYSKKHPILLSSKHHFTKLLFEHEHIRLLHAGPQQLLYSIRETYWPILGKNLARTTVHKCISCFKARPTSKHPLMGNLPAPRVTPSFPFMNTGVDYAGPFTLKDRRSRGFKTYKAYVSLFICLSTKAVHLELVTDLTGDAFISALKRFASRRGKPEHLFSDNGTNFVGSNNHLKELGNFLKHHNDEISTSSSFQEIQWHFIPAYSPHFGGLWEAGVKSMKGHLKRILSDALLTYEDFQTILVQVEAILNSRPLSPLSPDPSDLNPLTPSHFLIGRTLSSVPEHNQLEVKINRLNNFERIQQLRQQLWKRWSVEYISELQGRQKWKQNASSLQVDHLVLIKEPNLSPLQWRLGRVITLHAGQDGISRVATLRTVKGEVQRAITNLCPLPLTSDTEQ